MIGPTTLGQLPYLRDYRSKRASSYDTAGNNNDWWTIEAGARSTVFETKESGCIKHIWMTVGNDEEYLRRAVIRMWWDGEETPSVECPLGDFFGLGHGMRRNFVSLPLQMSPEDGRGMNCWWPLPFDAARVEIHNECENPINVYFYIDYEEYSTPLAVAPGGGLTGEIGRFHCQWRREAETEGWLEEKLGPDNVWDVWSRRPNVTGDDNYVILEAEGSGIFVGCHLDIDCFKPQGNDWYGEGDDMIFIDGEPWPPSLHGTGTEDYVCTAFGPKTEYCAPYHGVTVWSGNPHWGWKGKNSCYRYHIEDPIRFRKSIKVTIEHGHANKLSNDYSSTAYWYQTEPHKPFPALLPVEGRLPRPNEPGFP